MRIDENEVYTTKEVAEILKVSLPTIKRMLADGRLPSTRIGRQHRFLGQDILDILQSQRDLRPAAPREEFKPEPRAAEPTPTPITPVAQQPDRPSAADKQRSFMIGKKLRADIMDKDGTVLFARGTIVTDSVISEATLHKKMVEVFSNLE